MSLLELTTTAPATRADTQAERNRIENLRALAQTQPSLAIALAMRTPDLQWIYGRDGALTAQTPDGRWLTDCSLPHRTAQALLGRPTVGGTTACFLSPSHAAQIRVGLDALRPDQALIAIVPDLDLVATMIHCVDFSADLAARRLWIAAGSDWTAEISAIFTGNPGLPTPLQFLRTSLLHGDDANRMIPLAERTFAAVGEQRAREIERLRSHPRPRNHQPRICMLGPSRFQLWNDASRLLLGLLKNDGFEIDHLDTNRPDRGANLGLALSASTADILLTANAARTDLPPVLSPNLPVITWITSPRIPAHDAQSPRDALILADETWLPAARAAGWPADRLSIGVWPTCPELRAPDAPSHLAIIADTADTSPDHQRFDLSSHRPLWELIRDELLINPFALPADIGGYLRQRMDRLGIQSQGFDSRRFVDDLIVPAWQQGLAQVLLRAGLPLRLYGRNWNAIAPFQPLAAGEVHTMDQLLAAAESAAALIHLWPIAGAHPIDALRRPVVRSSFSATRFLTDARRTLTAPPAVSRSPELSPATLRHSIAHCLRT
jgi:hypothetical protein